MACLCALGLLSACNDDEQASTASEEKSVKQVKYHATESLENTAKEVTQSLRQHKDSLDKSINDLSDTLTELSSTYEKDLKVDEKKIDELANKLGKLAKQAGEGARMLETTTKTLSGAIQQGFDEGYNQRKKSESNSN